MVAAWLSHKQVKTAKEAPEMSADAAQITVFENILRDIRE